MKDYLKLVQTEKAQVNLQGKQAKRSELAGVPPIVHDILQNQGEPLEPQTRSSMESRFGHDFSSVRVHTDAKAAESARATHASALTVGQDILFSSGHYNPKTFAGRDLLAHELAHVVQQEKGNDDGTSTNALEFEANRTAQTTSSGQPTQVSLSAPLGIQRQPLSTRATATVTRQEAQQALENRLNQTLQLQRQMQGDNARRSLRVTPEVKTAVLLMYRNDPDIGHQISIQGWLESKIFPSEVTEFAQQATRYLPEQLPIANIAHLQRTPTDDRSTLGRVRDVVERSAPGEPGPDSPTVRATPPHEPTSTERFDKFMQDQERNTRRERGLPEPTQIGPGSIDVLRVGRILSGLPGAINPPHRTSPAPQPHSYAEVEQAIEQITSNSMTPASLRGTAQANGFPDAQEVARNLTRFLDIAQQQRQDSIALDLGAYTNQQDEILQGFREVLRVVVNALPHHASSVRTVIVTIGGRQRWVPVPRVEPANP
ncbi:MAG: DUF4157 domain-containing protein [Trueperaceae bacterium]